MPKYDRGFYESDFFRGLYSQYSATYSWLTEDMFRYLWDLGAIRPNHVSDGLFSGGHTEWDVDDVTNGWFTWYGNYLSRIEKYKGTEYYEQLLNNPYASYQAGLSQTDWNERFNSAEVEYNKILGTVQQNNYNSTVAAAARDKQAGFNDALSGSLVGSQAAADNAPSDARPTAGVSDDAKLQAEVQERQNSFDRAFKIASLPLDFITSISGGMSSFAGLMKVGAEVSGLVASAGASDAAAALATQQAAGQQAQNQNTWRGQFLDTIMGGVDLTKGSVNIADRIKSVDKTSMSPEQAEYFDSLVNSGYFADSAGNASAAALQDYSSRLAGTSGNMYTAGLNVGRIGGFTALGDPSVAVSNIFGVYGEYELEALRLDLASRDMSTRLTAAQTDLVALQQLKTAQETANLEQEGVNLVTENEKLTAEAATAELDRKIREREAEIQGLVADIQKNDLRRDKLRSESYNRMLDFAEKSDNFFVKYGTSRFIRTLDDSNESYQKRTARGLDNMGKVANLLPSPSAK